MLKISRYSFANIAFCLSFMFAIPHSLVNLTLLPCLNIMCNCGGKQLPRTSLYDAHAYLQTHMKNMFSFLTWRGKSMTLGGLMAHKDRRNGSQL